MCVAWAPRAGVAPRASGLGEELILKPIRHFDEVLGVRRPRMSLARAEPSAARFSGFREPDGLAGDVVADEKVNYNRLLEVREHILEDGAQPIG